jgi:hypothetical protein
MHVSSRIDFCVAISIFWNYIFLKTYFTRVRRITLLLIIKLAYHLFIFVTSCLKFTFLLILSV